MPQALSPNKLVALVQESKYFICPEKFKVANLLGDWIVYINPEGLSYFCDLTSYDIPWALLPDFAGFIMSIRRVWVVFLLSGVQSWGRGLSRVIILMREE